jgi:methionyl-tRNA formyltransferase
MISKVYFFTSSETFKHVTHFHSKNALKEEFILCENVRSLEALLDKEKNRKTCLMLVSFGIGEIIPPAVLERFHLAINIHAASPQYPGRDPHHYAAYDNASTYGATAHIIEEAVDAGNIIDVELIDVPPHTNSIRFLEIGNQCGNILLDRILTKILIEKKEFSPLPRTWAKIKRKRADLKSFSKVSPLASKQELDRKYRAFQENISFKNLYIDLHGYRFRFEEKAEGPSSADSDFTWEAYANYLRQAKKDYKFIGYEEIDQPNPFSILWRHDVDFSVHNALKLAQIENELNIQSTYFFMLGSWFYDIRDREILNLIQKIHEQGHHIGLHYDFEYLPREEGESFDSFLPSLDYQKKEMEYILQIPIKAFSFHNPTCVDSLLFTHLTQNHTILGMVNSYSQKIQKKFKYCSDSNGLWRFEKLIDVIDATKYPHLHILTHPEWWTKYSLSPRQKIENVLCGRARDILKRYDLTLEAHNRPNW